MHQPSDDAGKSAGRLRAVFRGLLAAAVCANIACGTGETAGATSEWKATVDTIGDTIRVRTVAGRQWPADGRLEPVVSVGQRDGAPEYEFGSIRGLAIGGDGSIFVLDGHGPVLRSYAADGTFRDVVAAAGEGPGELRRPDSMLRLTDGSIAVRDPGNGRITVFAETGELLRSLPLAGSLSTGRPMVSLPDGGVATPVVQDLSASVPDWIWALARYHADGSIDTVSMPSTGLVQPSVSAGDGNSSSTMGVPYTAKEVIAFSPEGSAVVGINSEYSFSVLRPDSSVLNIERAYTPAPVLPEEATVSRERITHNFRSSYPGWRWNGPDIPAHKPAYSAIYAADDGRFWVRPHVASVRALTEAEQEAEANRRQGPVNPYQEPLAFDVFEADGAYAGRVYGPDNLRLFPLPVIRGDTVWAVTSDELDVQSVTRFAVHFAAVKTST